MDKLEARAVFYKKSAEIIDAVSDIMESMENNVAYHAERSGEGYHDTKKSAYKVILNILNKTDFSEFLKEIEKEVNNGQN